MIGLQVVKYLFNHWHFVVGMWEFTTECIGDTTDPEPIQLDMVPHGVIALLTLMSGSAHDVC